jgi:high-affinity iron transporter
MHSAMMLDRRIGVAVPLLGAAWLGWLYSYWETLGAQLLAGLFVVGSYYAAEYVRGRRPRARGERPAVAAEAAPIGAWPTDAA